jgi:hypothetical protein
VERLRALRPESQSATGLAGAYDSRDPFFKRETLAWKKPSRILDMTRSRFSRESASLAS